MIIPHFKAMLRISVRCQAITSLDPIGIPAFAYVGVCPRPSVANDSKRPPFNPYKPEG